MGGVHEVNHIRKVQAQCSEIELQYLGDHQRTEKEGKRKPRIFKIVVRQSTRSLSMGHGCWYCADLVARKIVYAFLECFSIVVRLVPLRLASS